MDRWRQQGSLVLRGWVLNDKHSVIAMDGLVDCNGRAGTCGSTLVDDTRIGHKYAAGMLAARSVGSYALVCFSFVTSKWLST